MTQQKKNKIYLFTNIRVSTKVPIAGGEIGNQKTIKILSSSRFEIKIIKKYSKSTLKKVFKSFALFFKVFNNVCQYSMTLLFGRRKKSIVHIVGFYGKMIYFDSLLVCLAKILGYRVVYEMRGGGAMNFYKNYSSLYRKTFNNCIKLSDYIFSQGLENKGLIESIMPNKPFFYYPNFVEDSFIPQELPTKGSTPQFIYFGRITESKNVFFTLEVFKKLLDYYPDSQLTIIGNGDQSQELQSRINGNEFNNCVKYYAEKSHPELLNYLLISHIFLFPSKEKREGHSNALTEAMAYGIVPIASDQGFNRSVIGRDDLIISDFEVELYTEAILKVMGNYHFYSDHVYNRIKNNFTEQIVGDKLIAYYEKIFSTL